MHRLFRRTRHEAGEARERPTLASFAAVVRSHIKEFIVIIVIAVCIPLASWGFNAYADRMFFNEGAEHLTQTYKQVASTFELFSDRNWTFLDAWEESLKYTSISTDAEDTWNYYADLRDTWHYSDFYLFNADDEYVTAAGRKGTASSIENVFDEMFESAGPLASSYIASNGTRKIVFAKPLEDPLEMDGVTYTGVAVSYDNDYVQNFITPDIYTDCSDCYIVKQDGDVAFSLAPKTVFTDFISNFDTFLNKVVTFERGTAQEVTDGISNVGQGSALVSYSGSNYYVIYQPAGILDWSIVSIVKADVVDENLNSVKTFTIVAQSVLAVVMFAGVVVILLEKYHRLVAQEKEGRRVAEKRGKTAHDLLEGMAEIADRYVVADLAEDTYEYHECLLDHDLYPVEGCYGDLLGLLTHRYAALTDTDDAKMTRLLSAGVLRDELKSKGDRVKIEYASRTEPVYMLMTVVPVSFDENGELRRVLLIGQDIGLRKELENEANTDALTGLFNKRYFANILAIKQRKQIPFTLLFLDLDCFKPVNDTYGHAVGDELLKQVGERLQACVRTDDFAFRLGGDEFAVIVTGELDAVRASQVKERIRSRLCDPYFINGALVSVGASCGCASWPQESDDVHEVHALADKRMYQDKESRRSLYGGEDR